MTESGESSRRVERICEICFEEIPEGEPVVRAARQLDVSLGNPRAGKIDGSIIRCDEKCWKSLSLTTTYRRLPDE